MISNTITRAALAILCLGSLSACSQSSLRLDPDFGKALRQDLAAQIADPDAHYEGTPAPGSAGTRVGLAQKRYNTGQVIQPSSMSASSRSLGGIDNGSNGGGGGGGGAGTGVSMSNGGQ